MTGIHGKVRKVAVVGRLYTCGEDAGVDYKNWRNIKIKNTGQAIYPVFLIHSRLFYAATMMLVLFLITGNIFIIINTYKVKVIFIVL